MPKKVLISITDYLKTRFVAGSAPDKRTIKKMIEDGTLSGKKIGYRYYVELFDDMSEVNGITGGKYHG